jgi:hypothetical protein
MMIIISEDLCYLIFSLLQLDQEHFVVVLANLYLSPFLNPLHTISVAKKPLNTLSIFRSCLSQNIPFSTSFLNTLNLRPSHTERERCSFTPVQNMAPFN